MKHLALAALAAGLAALGNLAHAQWSTRATLTNVSVLAVVAGTPAPRIFALRPADGKTRLVSTDDEGLTWQGHDIAGDPQPFLYGMTTVPRPDGQPSTDGPLYASVAQSGDFLADTRCALHRSDDRGVSWTRLANSTFACVFAMDPSDTRVLYGIGEGYPATLYPRIYRSTDGGVNWVSVAAGLTRAVWGVRVGSDGRVFAMGEGVISISGDRGATWNTVTAWPRYGTSYAGIVRVMDLLPVRHPVHGEAYALVATDDGLYEIVGNEARPIGLQGFSIMKLAVARTSAGGEVDVTFGFMGGIGSIRVGSGTTIALQNGLPPATTAYGVTGGRYAYGPAGLLVCADFDACIGGALPHSIAMIEFHNDLLDHYFVTRDADEAAGIDAGAAGPGWTRTGLSFPVYPDRIGTGYAAQPACRFYGTPGRGPNSHFFTSDPGECERVKSDPGWMLETASAFVAHVPAYAYFADTGTSGYDCGARQAVLRLYNGRFAQNDSNHRYTTDPAVYAAMQAKGWIGEGVRLCVPRG